MNTMNTNTIIVGGGIAGMACALKLRDAQRDYVMITEDIGGRINCSADYGMNFGADFYTKGHCRSHELLKPVGRVMRSCFDLQCHRHLGKGRGAFLTAALDAPVQLRRFTRYLRNKFEPHYADFRFRCETMEFVDAIAADPFMLDLFESSAAYTLARLKVEKVAERLVSQVVRACTGARVSDLNGLDYMIFARLLVDRPVRFAFDAKETQAELEYGSGRVVMARVDSVRKQNDGFVVFANGVEYTCSNLVVATSAAAAEKLLEPIVGPYEVRTATTLYVYKVFGDIKPEYAAGSVHVFDDSLPVVNLVKQSDGAWRVTTVVPIDMLSIFDEHQIVHCEEWNPAYFVRWSKPSGSRPCLRQSLGNGLYRIGDHNAPGLESAAVSGVFAANEIINGGSKSRATN